MSNNTKVLWKLKPKLKKSKRVQFPVCPLCSKPMLPKEKLETIIFNRKEVQVHKNC